MQKPHIQTIPMNEQPVSLVEQIFLDPDRVNQSEYSAIYDLLLDPGVCDDPQAIQGVLQEFLGWAEHMIQRMHALGIVEGK